MSRQFSKEEMQMANILVSAQHPSPYGKQKLKLLEDLISPTLKTTIINKTNDGGGQGSGGVCGEGNEYSQDVLYEIIKEHIKPLF